MHDAKNLSRLELGDLEQQVAAILELPEVAQAAAFAKLRQRHPNAADLLLRWERAALEIDAAQRMMPSVATEVHLRESVPRPDRIGPFRILDVLGEGGMGVVYLAEQETPVRRRVALKVIRSGMDSKDVLARFEAERQAVAVMTHPNIAKVLDAGATGEGQPYFALEHVPGVPLTEYSDRQRLDLRERIALFQKVCHGVQHAHQKGIVHRDLKPGNILVQVRDGFADPKIIDFGVAKATQQRLTERTLYTEQGRILGTPEYMSPEQAEMSGLDIDTRSDIYSLGVLLYELLAGNLPFDSTDLRRAGHFEMQRKIREDEPQKPSTRCSTLSAEVITTVAAHRRMDARALARALHGDLDWIVMRCLEKDPARRYPTASELAADLQRYLDDEPVEAGPPSARYRLGKLVRKHRGSITAAAAVFLALALGLSFALWQWDEARAHAQTAEAELNRSQALNMVAASDRVMGDDPVVGLLLALRAHDKDPGPETIGQVQRAMAEQFMVARYEGHTDTVTSADYGEVHRRVVTGSVDGTVRVYRESGEVIAVLDHGGRVFQVAFSKDGQQILTVAASGENRIARVFELGGAPRRLIGDQRPLSAAHWDPRTDRLVVQFADGNREISILDASGAVGRVLVARPRNLFRAGLFFSPEGHVVTTSRYWANVYLQGRAEPTRLRLPEGKHPDGYNEIRIRSGGGSIAFDPKGELIATLHSDDSVRVWNREGELLFQLVDHTYHVNGVQFSPDSERILTASSDGSARLWDRSGRRCAVLSPGRELTGARFFGSKDRILVSAPLALFNAEGKLLQALSGNGRIADTAPADGLVLMRHSREAVLYRLGGVEAWHLRCDGDRPWMRPREHPGGEIFAGSNRGRVYAWDRSGRVSRVLDTGTGKPVYGVGVSPDGSRIVVGGADGMLFGWEWPTGKPLFRHRVGTSENTGVIVPESGPMWVASAPSNSLFLVDSASGESERVDTSIGGQKRRAFSAKMSSRGDLVVVRVRDAGELLLHGPRGDRLAEFRPHEEFIQAFDFFPDGDQLLTAANDRTVKLWSCAAVLADPRRVAPLATISIETLPNIADISPDGTRILIATNARAFVMDLEGRIQFHFWPRRRQEGYIFPVWGFSRDGRWLLGSRFDGWRRWPAQPKALLDVARKWADRLGRDRDLTEFAHVLDSPERSR